MDNYNKKRSNVAEEAAKVRKSTFPIFIKLLLLCLLVVITIVCTVIFVTNTKSEKLEASVFVEHVKELATLASAEVSTKVVIQKEDAKELIGITIPGTSRELILIVPGTALAGVDLQQVTEQDIQYDHDNKTLSIVVPHAAFLQEPTLHMDDIVVFSKEGIFRDDVNWEEGFAYAAEAQQLITKELTEQGVLQTAEKNAANALKEFFGHLDYQVEVSFQ